MRKFLLLGLLSLVACTGGSSASNTQISATDTKHCHGHHCGCGNPPSGPSDPNAAPTGDGNTTTTAAPAPGDGNATTGDGNGTAAAPTPTGDANNVTCPNLGTWDAGNVTFETQVLDLVNQARAAGANCHSAGTFGPQAPLAIDPRLVCLARGFAQEMQVDNFFDHTDPNGVGPFDRMANAGITFSSAGENIAEGQTTPQEVVQAWLNSDGHCANIMGTYTVTGIGFFKNFWVQDFVNP